MPPTGILPCTPEQPQSNDGTYNGEPQSPPAKQLRQLTSSNAALLPQQSPAASLQNQAQAHQTQQHLTAVPLPDTCSARQVVLSPIRPTRSRGLGMMQPPQQQPKELQQGVALALALLQLFLSYSYEPTRLW